MSVSVTAEQKTAIEARGRVIVSASAGSGKTFVMIERLVSLILEGADVRSVLCVTFTNKAAAQMQSRLRAALLKRISEVSGEERQKLKAQLAALPLADISTIHAFCARLIRTYFYFLGIDPSFRIISPDDAEGKTLSARAIAETFESAYESGGEEFAELLSVYFRKKKDTRLRSIVLSLLSSVRGNADYRAILERTGSEDQFDKAVAYLEKSYRARALFLKEEVERRGAYFAEAGKQALEVCRTIAAACDNLLGAEDLFDMAKRAEVSPAITRMPPMTKATGDTYLNLKFLSGASKAVKALYGELREYAERGVEYARYTDAQSRARALAALALEYDELYTRFKREANVLDYDDLEHFALEILSNEEARRGISGKYKYVFVDEYQDVNPVQERILFSVGGDEVFLVGDSKQAIYGFRGSRSEYFERKEKELEHSLRLTSNFRSAPRVLEAVNRTFEPILKQYVPMQGGERYKEHAGGVCFHWVREEEEKEKPPRGIYSVLTESEEQRDVLAEQVADLIEAEYGSQWYDADADTVRPVTFGDIAVLARKNDALVERIVRTLGRRGVPVTTSSRVNVCDYFEARLLIDWLQLLDNAEQDIPLATALLSAIGGFTEEELAKIRLRFPSPRTFRAACREYQKKMNDALAKKLQAFGEKLEAYRAASRVRTAAEMLAALLAEGLEAQIASKAGGRGRLARVRRLLFEAENAGSVHSFLARLKACDYIVEFSESAGDEAVKVLTMHASKGLEYPIVILAGMDGDFHGADHDDVLWTDEFYASPRSFDLEKKLTYETVMRRAAKTVQTERGIKDECNLLYVAMTRARYRLHVLFGGGERALSPVYAKRFSDFFDLAALSDYFVEEGEVSRPPLERKTLAYSPDEPLFKALEGVYRKPYAYAASTLLPVKSSATALMQSEERKPYAGGGKDALQGYTTDTGTAYHAFLQHVTFGGNASEELARMKAEGLLTEAQAALLDENKLAEILEMPCLKALAGKRLRREQTFLVSLPASEVFDCDADDEIVFQGAIDLLVEDENGYTVIDYKFSSHDDERIRTDYAPQIRLYKKAVSRAMRVDEKTVRARIVNIAKGREIETDQ